MIKYLIQLHFAVFLAGFTGVFGRLISYDAFTLVLLRFTVAAVAVVAYVYFTKRLVYFDLKSKLKTMFVGGLLCLHFIFFYLSIKLSNISIGTITIAATCFFTTAFEPIILKTRFKPTNLIYGLIIIAGLLLIFNFDTKFRLGIIIGFISAMFSSLYSIYNKKFTPTLDPYTCINYEMFGGLLVSAICYPICRMKGAADEFYFNSHNIFYLFALGSVFTVYLYLLVIKLSSKLSAFTINLTFNLEPVYAIIIAMLFFGEAKEVNLSFYIGVVLVALSVFLQNRKVKKNESS